MNENLSVWSLIINAGPLVQAVMGLLFLASLLSWWIIAQRFLFFRTARQEYDAFEGEFWSGIDLSQLYRDGNSRLESGKQIGGSENVFRAGFKEFLCEGTVRVVCVARAAMKPVAFPAEMRAALQC